MRLLPATAIGLLLMSAGHAAMAQDVQQDPAPYAHKTEPSLKNPVRWPTSPVAGVWSPFAWGSHYGLGWAGWNGWSGWGPLYQPAVIIGRMKVDLDRPSKSELVWGDVNRKKHH